MAWRGSGVRIPLAPRLEGFRRDSEAFFFTVSRRLPGNPLIGCENQESENHDRRSTVPAPRTHRIQSRQTAARTNRHSPRHRRTVAGGPKRVRIAKTYYWAKVAHLAEHNDQLAQPTYEARISQTSAKSTTRPPRPAACSSSHRICSARSRPRTPSPTSWGWTWNSTRVCANAASANGRHDPRGDLRALRRRLPFLARPHGRRNQAWRGKPHPYGPTRRGSRARHRRQTP